MLYFNVETLAKKGSNNSGTTVKYKCKTSVYLTYLFICRLTSIPVVASIQPQQPQCKACPIHILIIIVLSIKVQLRQQPWTLIQHPQVYLPHRFVFHSFFVNCQKINLVKIFSYPWHMQTIAKPFSIFDLLL